MTDVTITTTSAAPDRALQVRRYEGGEPVKPDTLLRCDESAQITVEPGVMYQFDEINVEPLEAVGSSETRGVSGLTPEIENMTDLDKFYGEKEDGTVMFDPEAVVPDGQEGIVYDEPTVPEEIDEAVLDMALAETGSTEQEVNEAPDFEDALAADLPEEDEEKDPLDDLL